MEDVRYGIKSHVYYTKAVVWGQQNGIIKGYSETEFAPGQNITREQIAAIMYCYAKLKDVALTDNRAIKLDYTDLADISGYAVESVMYCKLKGIMQGKDNNNFAPRDNATRAETAAILQRFIEADKLDSIITFKGIPPTKSGMPLNYIYGNFHSRCICGYNKYKDLERKFYFESYY